MTNETKPWAAPALTAKERASVVVQFILTRELSVACEVIEEAIEAAVADAAPKWTAVEEIEGITHWQYAVRARAAHGGERIMQRPTVHELKTWPEYFQSVKNGSKTFEYRKNDRDYKNGDLLALREWCPLTGYTGDAITKTVTYILRDFEGLTPGWVVMGLR